MVLKNKISITAEEAHKAFWCPYCQGNKDLINTLHHEWTDNGPELGQLVHIENNRLVVEEDTTESCKIKYCPMCGRKLKEPDTLFNWEK